MPPRRWMIPFLLNTGKSQFPPQNGLRNGLCAQMHLPLDGNRRPICSSKRSPFGKRLTQGISKLRCQHAMLELAEQHCQLGAQSHVVQT